MPTYRQVYRTAGLSDAQAWDQVSACTALIAKLIDAAISRGTIGKQDRADAIADATVTAFELAKKYDASLGEFPHYLTSSLAPRLHSAPAGSDALDHTAGDLEDVAKVVAEPAAREDVASPAALLERINTRLPGRLRAIAQMACIEHLEPIQIARRTGRTSPPSYVELCKLIKHCIRTVHGGTDGEGKN